MVDKKYQELIDYVGKFNREDEELMPQLIPNAEACDWMMENIPLLDCPDKELEEIYYFRWWVYRKHIKKTPKGYIITEFLPTVPWAGPYNSINCASGFHIREGRWLKHAAEYLEDYIMFWLNEDGESRSYSCWLAYAIWEYCSLKGDYRIALDNLDKICRNYEAWERKQLKAQGLFWSNDDRDAMEFSISGPGLRPTLNSYMYADAWAIYEFAKMAGDKELQEKYSRKSENLKQKIQNILWDEDFFKVIPTKYMKEIKNDKMDFSKIPDEFNVREEIGYIPWYFNMPDSGYEKAFCFLKCEDGFFGKFGLLTAERKHHRFSYSEEHECLWNGPVWPFATTQTLVAVANVLRNYGQDYITIQDYYNMLRQYAKSQHLRKEDGKIVPWIDENMDPDTGEWIARKILKENGCYERGKDYNHSMYCDLILSGLIGISMDKKRLEVHPLIPEDWKYFSVKDLYLAGDSYSVYYDKTGEYYHEGKGIRIIKE